jgi:esterase/lipase superfamily enzyme
MPPLLRSTLAASLALILLSSCAGHGTMSFVDAPAGVGKRQSIFVVTNRKKDETGDVFSGERSTSLSYSSYTVSVPPGHKTGKVEWAEGKPDPKTDFVTVGAAQYPGSAAFKAAINAALAGKTGAEREVMVFVHGYNTSYSEGIYRLAQIKNDFQVPGLAVHFSWPSAADTKYYVYDRDSIALSRDGMQSMLQDLADTNVSRIILVGHSMGTYLTVETLRQMSMLGDTKFRNKLGPVVLLSPDIDVDVFKSQVSRINPLPQPFILFTSSKDRALKLSAIITGTKDRLGSLSSASEIGDEKITVVDVSKFAGGDKLNHFAVATSPALISLINGVLAAGGGAFLDPAQDINPVDASVNVVSGVTQIILSPLAILEPKR